MAEKAGFEPAVTCDTHDFQSCTFGRSVTSPKSGGWPLAAGGSGINCAGLKACSLTGLKFATTWKIVTQVRTWVHPVIFDI